jgi:hypothetical protein
MAQPPASDPVASREARIAALLEQLRPQLEQTLRHLVERAVDVPEAEEFGAIEYEFRDAGQRLVNEVRQATLASRKKTRTAKPARQLTWG